MKEVRFLCTFPGNENDNTNESAHDSDSGGDKLRDPPDLFARSAPNDICTSGSAGNGSGVSSNIGGGSGAVVSAGDRSEASGSAGDGREVSASPGGGRGASGSAGGVPAGGGLRACVDPKCPSV